MPRTTITPIQLPGGYAATTTALTWTAADVTNKNQFVMSDDDILLIRNADGAAAHNFTLTSAPDPFGRTKDVTENLPASGYRVFGPLKQVGWLQIDGKFYLEADSDMIQFVVLRR